MGAWAIVAPERACRPDEDQQSVPSGAAPPEGSPHGRFDKKSRGYPVPEPSRDRLSISPGVLPGSPRATSFNSLKVLRWDPPA